MLQNPLTLLTRKFINTYNKQGTHKSRYTSLMVLAWFYVGRHFQGAFCLPFALKKYEIVSKSSMAEE